VVHGDDLTALGLQPDLDWYEKELAKSFELKIRGRIGENTELKTMRILNRIVTLTPGLIYESDPRHAELMVRNVSLGESKRVGTPGVKLPDISDEAPKDNGTEPWDDEPWRDSNTNNDSEIGTTGDDDNDNVKNGCGNLLDSHEKREFDQLKACVIQSLYGYSECTGASPERFTTMADSTAKPTQGSSTCTGISPELLAYIGGGHMEIAGMNTMDVDTDTDYEPTDSAMPGASVGEPCHKHGLGITNQLSIIAGHHV
jgi:hypothetical protein